jgi:hypothetical protein
MNAENGQPSFSDEVKANMAPEPLLDVTESVLSTDAADIHVRQRGCFITECRLTSPTSNQQVEVLHADSDHRVAKLTASHIMSPVGPSEGIGGQHGFPRWADFHPFDREDGPDGAKRLSLQAKRSDTGLSVVKAIDLLDNQIASQTIISNPSAEPQSVSLGEHYYFTLTDEDPTGLKVNGSTLDELLGEDAQRKIMGGEPLFWADFDGSASIEFPVGYSLKLSAESTEGKVGMLVWHREGTPSICFEPTVGFDMSSGGEGIELPAYGDATLTTTIELL